MAKTPNVALRFDETVYEAFKQRMAEQGLSVTGELEKFMSERTGVALTRRKPGVFGNGKTTMSVACPFCEAAPREACRNKYTGEPVGRPHPQRIRAAEAA